MMPCDAAAQHPVSVSMFGSRVHRCGGANRARIKDGPFTTLLTRAGDEPDGLSRRRCSVVPREARGTPRQRNHVDGCPRRTLPMAARAKPLTANGIRLHDGHPGTCHKSGTGAGARMKGVETWAAAK